MTKIENPFASSEGRAKEVATLNPGMPVLFKAGDDDYMVIYKRYKNGHMVFATSLLSGAEFEAARIEVAECAECGSRNIGVEG